ncbi:MAG: cation transporter [Deltaproteobacteria bacterium]|nr:cation transporter [Deltaproteobacteria bacterium]
MGAQSAEPVRARARTTVGVRNTRGLAVTLVLVTAYMIAEVVGGILANSLALLADAAHMLGDAGALGLALFALWFARRPATAKHTYGFHRTEILAALANGATLIAIAISIIVEAYGRFRTPVEVRAGLLIVIATGGLLVNLVGLWMLHDDRDGVSLNLRGAWLHVFTDALGSVQAIIAGVLLWTLGWVWVDPLASVLIALLVVFSAWELLRGATAVLMEGAPGHIDVDEVRNAILATPGVGAVDDLHVWTITSGLEALSAHVLLCDDRPPRLLLNDIRDMLRARFRIDHVTIQVETESCEEAGLHP